MKSLVSATTAALLLTSSCSHSTPRDAGPGRTPQSDYAAYRGSNSMALQDHGGFDLNSYKLSRADLDDSVRKFGRSAADDLYAQIKQLQRFHAEKIEYMDKLRQVEAEARHVAYKATSLGIMGVTLAAFTGAAELVLASVGGRAAVVTLTTGITAESLSLGTIALGGTAIYGSSAYGLVLPIIEKYAESPAELSEDETLVAKSALLALDAHDLRAKLKATESDYMDQNTVWAKIKSGVTFGWSDVAGLSKTIRNLHQQAETLEAEITALSFEAKYFEALGQH